MLLLLFIYVNWKFPTFAIFSPKKWKNKQIKRETIVFTHSFSVSKKMFRINNFKNIFFSYTLVNFDLERKYT